MRGKLLATTALGSTLFLIPAVAFGQSAYDWTGAYVGASLGVVATTSDLEADGNELSFATKGGLAGLTAGYNVQLENFVVGIEADGSLTTVDGTNTNLIPFAGGDERLESLLTLRGRFGVTNGPVLAYATLGLAGGQASYTANVSDLGKGTPVPATASGFVTGVVAGAGVEVAVNDNLSVKTEGLMYQMSPLTASGDTGKGSFDSEYKPSGLVVRTGVNFHF